MSQGSALSAVVVLTILGCAQAIAGPGSCASSPATAQQTCSSAGFWIPPDFDPNALALIAHHTSGIFAQSWADERLRHAPYWLAIADATAIADSNDACPTDVLPELPVSMAAEAPLDADAAAMLTSLTALHRFSRLRLQP